jgi:prevent-host-death family protein
MISPKNVVPVTTLKRDLMKLLKKVDERGDLYLITRDGKSAGILMSVDEYEGLMETLQILSDRALLRSLKRAEEDFRKGRTYTHKQVFSE